MLQQRYEQTRGSLEDMRSEQDRIAAEQAAGEAEMSSHLNAIRADVLDLASEQEQGRGRLSRRDYDRESRHHSAETEQIDRFVDTSGGPGTQHGPADEGAEAMRHSALTASATGILRREDLGKGRSDTASRPQHPHTSYRDPKPTSGPHAGLLARREDNGDDASPRPLRGHSPSGGDTGVSWKGSTGFTSPSIKQFDSKGYAPRTSHRQSHGGTTEVEIEIQTGRGSRGLDS